LSFSIQNEAKEYKKPSQNNAKREVRERERERERLRKRESAKERETKIERERR
jgi:hypothetical protein